jgi:hypothetical protein
MHLDDLEIFCWFLKDDFRFHARADLFYCNDHVINDTTKSWSTRPGFLTQLIWNSYAMIYSNVSREGQVDLKVDEGQNGFRF